MDATTEHSYERYVDGLAQRSVRDGAVSYGDGWYYVKGVRQGPEAEITLELEDSDEATSRLQLSDPEHIEVPTGGLLLRSKRQSLEVQLFATLGELYAYLAHVPITVGDIPETIYARFLARGCE